MRRTAAQAGGLAGATTSIYRLAGRDDCGFSDGWFAPDHAGVLVQDFFRASSSASHSISVPTVMRRQSSMRAVLK